MTMFKASIYTGHSEYSIRRAIDLLTHPTAVENLRPQGLTACMSPQWALIHEL